MPKEITSEKLPIRRIAKFLNVDSQHEMSNINVFSTDSRMLESTIELFMKDVEQMQNAQLEVEEEREKRDTKIKKDRAEHKQELDSTIMNADEKSNEKRMLKY